MAEKIAMTFAKQRRNISSDFVAVIFEIKAKSNLKSVIFADIRHLSAIGPDEEEVLFSIGAVFRIDEVVYDNNRNLWAILMTATDEGYENVLPFIEATAQNREETSDNVFFGRLLNDMGRYQQAETYCKKLLQTMPKNHPDRAGVYHNLGRAQGNKGELNEATVSFTQALDIRRGLDMNHLDVARTLNSLGVIHGEKGEYGKAMKKFEKAVEIQRKSNEYNKGENTISKKNLLLNMAMSYSNIGWVHSLCGAYDKASSAHSEALKIRKDLLKVEDHPLFADYHSAMGGIAHAKGLYDNARAEHTKALLMRQRILPPAHPSIANSYQSLGEIEHENGKYEKALEYYEEACHIRTQTLGVQHLSMAAIYKSIGSVHLDSGAYDKALEFYERALSICQKNVSAGHPAIGDCYHLIGTVYERQGHYGKALGHYVNVHQIVVTHLPVEHPMVAKIYSSIANVQMRQQQYNEALILYGSVLKIQEKRLSEVKHHHPDIILTLNNLGVLYRYQKDFDKAKQYFERALQICDGCFSNNPHPARARTLHNMGEMYLVQKKFDDAVKNFEKAIIIREDTLPDDDLSTADSYYKLGYVWFAKDDYVQALNYFTKSRGIYQLKHRPDHDDMKRVQRSIAIAQENLGMRRGSISVAT
ncbi:unnamed protein product [Rotaria sordida]|uniref:Uncharacterized protein n=1 Tax=Rotaria sordida TaxID=392033 RepID=A0A815KD95_9BILA|nr:unnamed protein product [Rotaria sordida]CAF4014662.1 unnamed protein product [Rotaria sordida]